MSVSLIKKAGVFSTVESDEVATKVKLGVFINLNINLWCWWLILVDVYIIFGNVRGRLSENEDG